MNDIDDRLPRGGGLELIERLKSGGVAAITGQRIPDACRELEAEATRTGLSAPQFISEGLSELAALFIRRARQVWRH